MDTSNKTIMKPKHRFIRLNEVMSRTGYGRTSIYRKMEDGSFPKSLKLGGPPKDPNEFDSRAVAWIEDELDQWMESRIEDRVSI
jgi:prophage regulatory protein